MLFSPQVRVSSTGRTHADNSRKASLLVAVADREVSMLTAADMAYALFDYTPAAPAAWAPDFSAVAGRIAWVNGRYTYTPDTSVTYRRGRRVVTEWHVLAGVRCS